MQGRCLGQSHCQGAAFWLVWPVQVLERVKGIAERDAGLLIQNFVVEQYQSYVHADLSYGVIALAYSRRGREGELLRGAQGETFASVGIDPIAASFVVVFFWRELWRVTVPFFDLNNHV